MPRVGYLLPTRERIMSREPHTGPMLELAVRAERLGWDSVWIGDSLLARPRHEPLTLLAAVAAQTRRVELGTAVLLPALLAYRVPARDFQERAVRWWPAVTLFVYIQPAGTFRNHAIEGLALPLAVLTVTGVAALDWGRVAATLRRARPRRALAIAAVAAWARPSSISTSWAAATSRARVRTVRACRIGGGTERVRSRFTQVHSAKKKVSGH